MTTPKVYGVGWFMILLALVGIGGLIWVEEDKLLGGLLVALSLCGGRAAWVANRPAPSLEAKLWHALLSRLAKKPPTSPLLVQERSSALRRVNRQPWER